jgi:nucleoside recognition membrane protein YjiH
MYEHKNQSLAPLHVYYRRIFRNIFLVSVVLIIMLVIGTLGFYFFTVKPVALIDAFHNASMILSGMGPILGDQLSTGGKIFSSFYAIFSGVIFMSSVGFILTPVVHRFLHTLHLQEK